MSESKDQNHITAWRSHWDAFDKNKDGKVDYFEVRGLIKSLYKPSSQEIDEVFAVFDKDGNQKISFDEFVSALTTVQAVKLDPVITTRPEFKDKKIATQQRTTVLDVSKEAKEELKKQFDALDKDKDGSISRAEASKLAQDRHEPPARVVNDVMRYLDKNRDGSVTFEEFSAAMEKCKGDIMTLLVRAEVPRITIEKDDLQRFLKNFKRLDSNNDGHLDSYEVRQLLKSLYAPSEEEINKIFDRFDKNKDGRITFNEFEDALTTIDVVATDAKISTKVGDKKVATAQQATKIKLTDQMREQLKQEFESIDVNKSGFIDRVEARRLAQDSYVPPSAAIDKVIAHMDINQDKTVSMEEFIAALQKAQGYLPELVKVSLDPKAAQAQAGVGADKKDDKKKA